MSETEAGIPRLEDGARVFVTDGEHEGRIGVIIDTVYKDEMEAFKARSGIQSVANFAKVDYYTIRTRDAFSDRLDVKPEEVTRTTDNNFGRITPPDLVEEYRKEEQRAIDIQHRGIDPDNAAPGSDYDLGDGSAASALKRSGAPGATEEQESVTGEADQSELEGTPAEDSQYADKTNEELQDELRDRDLPVSGNKEELIARLEEDDNKE